MSFCSTEKGLYGLTITRWNSFNRLCCMDVWIINIQYLNEDNDGNIWFCKGKQIGVATFSKNANTKPQVIYFLKWMESIIHLCGIYPLNWQNIFVASDKGMIHLNLDKYTKPSCATSTAPQIRVLEPITTRFMMATHECNNQTEFVLQQNNCPDFSINNNSFHFEFSSPVFSQQKILNMQHNWRIRIFMVGLEP